MSEQEKLELERYRAFHQRLRRRREEIPGELAALRQADKGNTLQFRELLSGGPILAPYENRGLV